MKTRHTLKKSIRFGGSAPFVLAGLCAIILAAVALPGLDLARLFLVRSRCSPVVAAKNSCINNLRQLDGAKEQWALENNLTNFSRVDVPAVLAYIKGGTLPVCPGGGNYHINNVGLPPYCSNRKHPLLWDCPGKLEALNAAVDFCSREHPRATRADFVPSDMFGFGKPLLEMPVCEHGGQYIFNRQLGAFSCSSCKRD